MLNNQILPPQYIDSHCHLEEETYGDELPSVITRAWQAGLSHMVVVGASRVTLGAREAVDLAHRTQLAKNNQDKRIETAEGQEGQGKNIVGVTGTIVATVGIHPHDAEPTTGDDIDEISQLVDDPHVVALGEIGLDYYYDNSPRQKQREVFCDLLAIAVQKNIPVMLHIRDAHEDCWEILDRVGLPKRGGVVHCFTAGPKEAKEYLQRGMFLSIPGIITYKSAQPLRDAVAITPLERLFVETDCPYLAPVPYRGKRNEPGYVTYTAEAVAQAKGEPLNKVALQMHQNTMAFYGLN